MATAPWWKPGCAASCAEYVLAQVRDGGFQGSDSAFYRWLAELKGTERSGSPACRFETDPGQQCLFDWAEYQVLLGGVLTDAFVFSLVLVNRRRWAALEGRANRLAAALDRARAAGCPVARQIRGCATDTVLDALIEWFEVRAAQARQAAPGERHRHDGRAAGRA